MPTLVASPAVMQFLQSHRAIIQFHQDPVTKAMQSSLIIPHNPQNTPQEHSGKKFLVFKILGFSI